MSVIGQKLGKYKIVSRLGSGGMGEVFLADDLTLGRRAALKFLSADLAADAEHRSRFIREARAASALSHPAICTVYQIEIDAQPPYIAMEYAEGETLADMIARRRRGAKQVVELAIQAAEALSEAHAAGIIHRDIKPANMVISERGRLKILDFGLAKVISGPIDPSASVLITATGIVLGTASYMSPEQARGFELDGRTDIWSLGICMYEALTGQQPFAAETTTDTLAAILTKTPLSPGSFFSDISTAVENVVLKCIAKDPAERYQTASELLGVLSRLKEELHRTEDISGSEQEAVTAALDLATTEFAGVITGKDLLERNARPNNLSGDLPRMVGRERETAEILELLRDPANRLITMTGIGGTGKTRLSRAVAEAALADHSDGVFFVELSTVADPQLVAAAVAQPLGIRDEGSRPVAELLTGFLREKQLLLVLDNFEQVAEAASLIGELLLACPRLKILITSRFLLRLSAEVEYIVPPLAMPLGGASAAQDNEAVSLFIERAAAAKPAFKPTEENLPIIADICRRLDGLPLAIELAAARIRILSPQAILAKLANRLNLLSGGTRDLPARQQTMRGAVEWSYQLLEPAEQALFRRLAVFNGGFRMEHAESLVADRSDLSSGPEVFELISSLLDKSLLLSRNADLDEIRFSMLEVVRDFAFEELAANGEFAATSGRHALLFTELAEYAEPFVQAAQSAEWLDRLAEENANLSSAMRWAVEHDALLAVRLATSLRNYWLLHGHLNEGFRWLRAALDLAESDAQQLKLLSGLGLAARFKGDLETAAEAYRRGLELGRRNDDKKGIALSLRGSGLVDLQRGDVRSAEENFSLGLAISRELKDDFGIAISLSFLGDVYRTEGRYAEAIPLFTESVELFRKVDNKSAVSDALNNLATAEFSQGDLANAEGHLRSALEIAGELGNKITLSFSLDGFAALAAKLGEYERAAYIAGAADYLRRSIGYQIEPAERAFRDSYIADLTAKMTRNGFDLASDSGANSAAVTALSEEILKDIPK